MLPIYIIGFMGSGKSTFGKLLAKRLNAKFIDLDHLVASTNGYTGLNDLIENKGMDFFREAESKTLKTTSGYDTIISTGGGTPCFFDNLNWMLNNGILLFLDLQEVALVSRLKTTDLTHRPLLKNLDEEGLKRFVHEKLMERMPYYSKAHISFNPISDNINDLIPKLQQMTGPELR